MRIGSAVLAVMWAVVAPAAAASGSNPDWLLGEWRVVQGRAAPWLAPDAAAVDRRHLIGQEVRFTPSRVDGPAPLACEGARYEYAAREPAGLFQGNLADAGKAAGLGITQPAVDSVVLTCDAGVFDLHRATPDAAVFALDNVIWTLDRSSGAVAADGTPEHAAQQLLEIHFGAPMGFLPQQVRNKQAWLSTGLAQRIDTYFARPFAADVVPPVDGDPFTDAQEYPSYFSVGAAHRGGDGSAVVPVRFDDGYRARTARYLMLRQAGGWRLDDIEYDHGARFSQIMEQDP